jgi:hypothetical protein
MLKTKIKKLCTFHRIVAVTALALLSVASINYPVFAQALTQGYGSDQILQRGMLIQLKKDDPSKVEAVKQATGDKLFGVVVDANDAPVTLSADGKKVFVATAGKYDVLVSTQNGSIKAGDYITISAIDGIGMKAGSKEAFIIGRALRDFDGTVNKVGTAQVKDSEGKTKDVTIGRVLSDVLVAGNPLLKAEEPNVPEALRKAAETIAGKPVNAVRIYAGLFVFMVSTIVASILMYGGVRSAIISIGRNPLGKKSIVRGMFQVIITGLIVFISGVFGVYLLLRV